MADPVDVDNDDELDANNASTNSTSTNSRERVVLGRVSGVHGVNGVVVLRSFTQDPLAIGEYGPLFVGDSDALLEIEHMSPHKGDFLVRFFGVEGRGPADKLKGVELSVDKSKLPQDGGDDDGFYFADLIGLLVKQDGKEVGKVVDVVNFGAGDLIDIEFEGRKKSELLAFNEDSVPVVDVAAGFIEVCPPDWMFEEKDIKKETDKDKAKEK